MTKRAYIDDPLQAAMAARDFGFKLYCDYKKDDEGYCEEPNYPFEHAMIDGEMWGDVIKSDCRNIYIHPDSMHLLEPQEGDRDIDGFTYNEKTQRWEFWDTGLGYTKPSSIITKRNGKPFPQVKWEET